VKQKMFILISTIDRRILNLKKIIQYDMSNVVYIISHQISQILDEDIWKFMDTLKKRDNIRYSVLKGKGVAKNRNNTLRFIEPSSICLILDDDVLLCQDAFSNIIKDFDNNPDADFISFKILDLEDSDYKTYPKEKQWHTFRTLTGIGTTEMAFRSDCILDNNVRFDERFGPGAQEYPMGEDFIFAMDLYQLKAKMLFLPLAIVKHPKESTGSSLDKKVIFARGAVFARVYGKRSYILDIYFTLKHKKMYKSRFTFFEYLKLMFRGSYDFLNRNKNHE